MVQVAFPLCIGNLILRKLTTRGTIECRLHSLIHSVRFVRLLVRMFECTHVHFHSI